MLERFIVEAIDREPHNVEMTFRALRQKNEDIVRFISIAFDNAIGKPALFILLIV
jgi:hypothetical protein